MTLKNISLKDLIKSIKRFFQNLSSLCRNVCDRVYANFEVVRRMMMSLPMLVLSCMLFSMTAMCVEMVDSKLKNDNAAILEQTTNS